MMPRAPAIAVIGPGDVPDSERDLLAIAHELGRLIAKRKLTLITGGLGGVMEAASRGASEAGGTVIGILPGDSAAEANTHVQIALATGMGQARNAIIINSADAVIAIGRGFGTLSEMALALRARKPVAAINSWEGIDPAVQRAANVGEALAWVIQQLEPSRA